MTLAKIEKIYKALQDGAYIAHWEGTIREARHEDASFFRRIENELNESREMLNVEHCASFIIRAISTKTFFSRFSYSISSIF